MERIAFYFGVAIFMDWLLSEYGKPYEPDYAAIAASVLLGFGLEALMMQSE